MRVEEEVACVFRLVGMGMGMGIWGFCYRASTNSNKLQLGRYVAESGGVIDR